MNYNYNAKFEGIILVVGRTGCRKTTFVQNLGKSKIFGNLKEVIWASKILLSKEREEQIRNCVVDEKADFEDVENTDEFDNLLEHIQKRKPQCNENNLGENIELDGLIVFNVLSGLADRSGSFTNVLTVSRKLGLTCVYIFNTLYPTRQNWQMILAQRKIFNIFPGSVQDSSIVKILSSFCSRYKYNHIPCRELWINQLYFDISNSSKKQCLTIDTREAYDLGSAKFRIQADNNR